MSRFFIVAVDKNWGIAKDHKIPWHYKEDFQFFKEKTQGVSCVMGYNTFKEIADMRKYPSEKKELLPGRSCFIVSSKTDIEHNVDVRIWDTPDASIWRSESLAFIGGTSIYDYAMSTSLTGASYGYVTRIKHDYDCNIFFNKDKLMENFHLQETLGETEDLVFELWVRKDNQ